jgi:hypothetical protein
LNWYPPLKLAILERCQEFRECRFECFESARRVPVREEAQSGDWYWGPPHKE